MARVVQSLYALNKGIISRLGLARVDLKRLAMAAEVQTNWMPRVLGSAAIRAGWEYLFSTLGNAAARYLRFIFATDDTALIELTDSVMRVSINDVLLTRPAVTTTIANGLFLTDLSSWTDKDEGSAASTWAATQDMQLVGTGTEYAIREQKVTCATANVEHALRISIARDPVYLRVGSSSGSDDYVAETTLGVGTHSIAFTPMGDFYVRFFSRLKQIVLVTSCEIETAGIVELPTPWVVADLDLIRYDQSADVLFVACDGHQPRKIERRGTRPGGRSWSVSLYQSNDGPFKIQNVTPTTIAPSAITGNITLTASSPIFKSTHVGGLFSITSVGQAVTLTSSTSTTYTNSIRVTGNDADGARSFLINISGNASGSTVDLQRSFDGATWANLGGTKVWTADTTEAFNDTLSQQIVYYRLALTTRVAPDSVTMELSWGGGSVKGYVRVNAFTDSKTVSAEVLSDLGGTTGTTTWQEGMWSDAQGWPTSVRIHEGRLWWAGKNGVWGSVSDAYDSFDETHLGDAGPINRTIGSGPVDTVNWLLSLKGLVLGAQGSEYTARASSLDEPLTPTNFNLKGSSSQGSGAVDCVKVDQSGYFANRSNTKVFSMAFDVRAYDYAAENVCQLAPEICLPGIVRMDVQRLPDTRIHCVLEDGTVMVAIIDKIEEVTCLIKVETSGYVEDVVVLPAIAGDLDDQVYYVVRRRINGADARYLEKWAQEADCIGDDLSLLADSHVTYDGPAIATITGLSHLEGHSVVVWADGEDVGTNDSARPWTQTYTVSGGSITLATAASKVCVGLGYEADFVSAKLGLQMQGGSTLNQQKRIDHLGLVMANVHPKGLRYGDEYGDVDKFDDLPELERGALQTSMRSEYDENLLTFPGAWETDSRVRLIAQAPRPVTVLAVTMSIQQNT